MKRIRNIEDKYYPTEEEAKLIKRELQYRYGDITLFPPKYLGMTYKTFWQKLYNKKRSYFSELERLRLIELTDLDL